MKYEIKEIISILKGARVKWGARQAVISTLLTDSRSLSAPEKTLFFALHTREGDGHNFVDQLYERGVRNFVVEREDIAAGKPDANFIVVRSPLAALQQIAAYHRGRFDMPVIAITGSKGKTIVKEWLYALLKDDYKVVRSPRSYNSQIGVPLSVWEMSDKHNLAIIEAGISTCGEMEKLEKMIRPTMVIVTNIGTEHDEGFESYGEKIAQKVKLAVGATTVLAPDNNPLLIQALDDAAPNALKRYVSAAEYSAILPTQGVLKTDAALCAACAEQMGVTGARLAERMKRLQPINTRTNVIEGVNNCTIIIDGYSSDFSSLAPALDFMLRRSVGAKHRTVILSDIDGGADALTYSRLGELLREKAVSRLIGIGRVMKQMGPTVEIGEKLFFETVGEMLQSLSQGDFENETVLLKVWPQPDGEAIVDLLEASRHQTVEEVDLNALAHNFKFFKSMLKPATKTVAMVKASGYGTGSYEIAKTLQDEGADYLAVAVQDEGVNLRNAGITMPIIVLNPSVVNYKAIYLNRLEPEVYSLDEARELIREGERLGIKDYPVHIKLDTGMHRLGFTFEQLPALVELLKGQAVVKPVSAFSHLAVADEPSKDGYSYTQFSLFDLCTEYLQSKFEHRIMRHILNTSGIVRFPERQYDMARIGIGLYGIKTLWDGSEDALMPVASLRSVIISIKEWDAGTTIGYGRRGVLTRRSRIATVTIGYADGLDRHFGNGKVSMWVNGTLCPTVGNVCMDAVMLDVTDAECAVGDKVEIFGPHIPIETLSEARGTIPYEVLTSVSPRVKRVYFRE